MGSKLKKLTQKRLKEVLHYNPDTGIFTWKIIKAGIKTGSEAGYLNKEDYIQIGIDNKLHSAHRLAWLYMKGYWPEHEIDHINRIRYHNWISNLREVSHQCNIRNTGNHKTNTSGIKGVYWHKQNQKWATQITFNNKRRFLGLYKSFDNAVCARLAAEQCLNWSGCDSNSPAYQYVKNRLENGDYFPETQCNA